MAGVSRQTRLGQPTTKKYGTISAGLMREHSTHLEKTRKSLPAVVRLQAGRSSRASLRADSQTLSSPPCVGIRWRVAVVRRRRVSTASARLKADGDVNKIMLLLTAKAAREIVETFKANTEAWKRLEDKIDGKTDA